MKEFFLRDYNNIAIIQTAFLGDVALTIPLAAKIKEINLGSHITFVTTPQSAEFVQFAKSIDNVISYDKKGKDKGYQGIKKIAAKLKDKDLLLIPHRSARSSLIGLLSGVALRIGFDSSSLSILHTKLIHRNYHDHEISKNLSILSAFRDFESQTGIKLKSDFMFNSDDISSVQDLIATNNFFTDRLIAIFPGSVWKTKRWIPSHFTNLINLLMTEGYNVGLMGSPTEKELCENIAFGTSAINLAGKMNISQSLIFIEKCQLVITNDSAPTHFAGLMGTPVLTIFGPTSPIFGFYPVGEGSSYIELQDLKCKPCEIHGSNKCPINTHECMVGIEPASVLRSALSILNRG